MDDSTILKQREEIIDNTVDKKAFSIFFKDQLKKLNEKSSQKITKKDIAQKLGITDEMFRKIVNKEKPTKKRDCIIAICIALDLQTSETNEGLQAYGFNELLDQDNDRDLLIMETIDQNAYDHISNDIDKINEALRKCFLPELDIMNHRKEVPKSIKRTYPYKLIKKWMRSFCETPLPKAFDKYKLKLLYNFGRNNKYPPLRKRYLNPCDVEAGMELKDKEKRMVLKAYSSGSLFLDIYTDSKYIPFQILNPALEETGELRSCFEELIETACNELRKSDLVYKDTKNFGHRISAKVIDNDLHVFMEEFNNKIPIRNEYYLMDYCNGDYTMSVSHDSGFMRKYLSKEEYEKKYGLVPYKPIKEYKALEDIEYFQVIKEKDDENPYSGLAYSLYRWRCNYFSTMKNEIDDFIKMLKKGREYIEYPGIYKKWPYDVIDDFCVAKEFDCKYVPNKDYVKRKKNIDERFETAKDVDSSFDFDAEYERIKNGNSLNTDTKVTIFLFDDTYNLENSYYRLKNKQGIKLGDMLYYYDDGKYAQKICAVKNPKPRFTLSDGQEVELSVQDLIDGAKLGLTTVEEVGSVKLKHGSLKIKDLL